MGGNGEHLRLRSSPDQEAAFFGLLGVLGFSLTLPATRIAVAELQPVFVGLGRALVAAFFAVVYLFVFRREPVPQRRDLFALFVTGLGVVVGFPLFSAWAMRSLPAAHGAIVTGLMPLFTSVLAALRGGEGHGPGFWAGSLAGSAAVVLFALDRSGGHIDAADLWLLAAVVTGAIGYAEGARLARAMGGARVICWALVLTAPFLVPPVALNVWTVPPVASASAWTAFVYVGVISMFLAFFAWYRGLALGGTARISQIQLLQPFFTIVVSVVFLDERWSVSMLIALLVVVASIFWTRSASVRNSG